MIADGDEVERHLTGIEVEGDVERDVRDRQVEVGDGGDEYQRNEDDAGARRARSLFRQPYADRITCCRRVPLLAEILALVAALLFAVAATLSRRGALALGLSPDSLRSFARLAASK